MYVLLAALVLYLGEILVRRIREMRRLKQAQGETGAGEAAPEYFSLSAPRVSLPEFCFQSFVSRIAPRPNCASGSQEIADFLGVAMYLQQYAVRFTRFAAQAD